MDMNKNIERNNFETLFQLTRDYAFVIRSSGKVLKRNTIAAEVFGNDTVFIPFKSQDSYATTQEESGNIIKELVNSIETNPIYEMIDIFGNLHSCEIQCIPIVFDNEECYLILINECTQNMILNSKYYKIFNSNTIPMLISDFATGNFLEVNEVALQLFGFDKKEIIGKKAFEFVKNASPEFRNSYFADLLKYNKVDDFRMKIASKDSIDRLCLVDMTVLNLDSGKVILTTIKDISKLETDEIVYTRLFDSVSFGIVCHESTGAIISANPAASVILGLTNDQLLGKTSRDPRWKAINEQGEELLPEEHPAMISLQKGIAVENQIIAVYIPENNTYRWIKVSSYPFFKPNGNGEPAFVYALFEDITAEKSRNEKLRILNLSVEHSPVSIVITDKNGTIEYVNPKFCETTSYSLEEAIGQNPKILKSGKLDESVYTDLWETIATGNTWTGELINKDKYDNIFWESVSISPIFNNFGKITHYVGIKENITHRKQAEEEQRFNLLRMQSLEKILKYPTDSIFDLLDIALEEIIKLTQSKLGYIYFYDESTQMFTLNSWSKEVMNECTIAEKQRVYELDKTGIWGEAVRQRKPIMINDFVAANPQKKGYPDGHAHLARFLTVPIFNNEKITAVVGVANKEKEYNDTDQLQMSLLMDAVWKVIERQRANEEVNNLLKEITYAKELTEVNLQQKNLLVEELETTKEQLIVSLNEKDKFFSIIAHDLRSPFSGFLGFTQIMAEDIQDLSVNEIQDISEKMQDSAKTLYQLLENLLEWARMKRGSISFNPENISIAAIVQTNISVIKLRANYKDVEIIASIPSQLYAYADLNLLNGVIRNLLSNALKFTPIGGNINIGTIDATDSTIIYIKDSGIGMSESTIGKLFKIDEKISRPGTEGESSTGLGLLLCKEYIDKHNGKIWAESEVNNGSTFFVSLPKL